MFLSITKRLLTKLIRTSNRYMPHGQHITRYVMYRQLAKSIETVRDGQILSIGHSTILAQLLCDNSRIVEANYPNQNWLNLPYRDGCFDLVVSDQVLEHVEGNPQHVIDESYRVTKSNGFVVCTSCLINGIHYQPGDYWRFTPDGLRFLHRNFSEIIQCGAWGSKWFVILDWLNLRFEPIPEVTWHPLHRIANTNDLVNPIVVWIVARK